MTRFQTDIGVNRESFVAVEVTDDITDCCIILRDKETPFLHRIPHLDKQREIQAAQAYIQYKDQETQFPQNPRAMEHYATSAEWFFTNNLRITRQCFSRNYYQQEHCERSGFKRTATACVREHCCRENERTFPVGALRVAISYWDRRNYQSGRGASVRKVQYIYQKGVFLRTLVTVAILT